MDFYSQLSVITPFKSISFTEAVAGFEKISVTEFCPLFAAQNDLAFSFAEFQSFLSPHDIFFCPVPRQRHHKNLLESKHGVICSIFSCLKHAFSISSFKLLAVTAICKSNELYGSDTLSFLKLPKNFSNQVVTPFSHKSKL